MRFYFKKEKNEDIGKKLPKYSIFIKDLSIELRSYNHSNLSMEIYESGIYTTVPFKYFRLKFFSFNKGNGNEKVLLEKYPPSYGSTVLLQSNDIDVLG